MTDQSTEELEERVKELEKFVAEVQSGKRLLLSFLIFLAGVSATAYYVLSSWKVWHG